MENPPGLSFTQARAKLKEYGFNEIRDVKKVGPLQILFRQVRKNLILYLLLFAALISFVVGETVTGYTIFLVIILVISITFAQEYRAERAIETLREMIISISRVIRDGKEQEVLSKELVPGDVIVLRSGEKVPADCFLLKENNLLVNESVLTGESKEITKSITKNEQEYDDGNLLFMGSFIINGRCFAKVLHTGMNTRFGAIANMISETEKSLPLQDKVNRLTRYLVIIALILAPMTGILMLSRVEALTPQVLTEIFIFTLAFAVSAFPEGLPVVLMTTLAVGASRMAKRGAIVNRMSIIETLGETTVICADKTGTLTSGEMTVKKVFADGKTFDIGGSGYEAFGDFSFRGEKVEAPKDEVLRKLLEASVLCNDARIERTGEDHEYKIFGTPTEASLLIMAAKADLFGEDLRWIREEEVPFSSERKMMSVLGHSLSQYSLFAKGAPEMVLERCQFVQTGKGVKTLTEEEKAKIFKVSTELSQKSYRILALAYQKMEQKVKSYREDGLVFLGLVGIEDPPREEVKEALRVCQEAGITVKMVTGDHRETAMAVAERVGLFGEVLEGSDLERMSEDELSLVIDRIAIFARVKPEHKLKIVKVLQQKGEVVTMTGDGVNDAPALKEAHIGIAMGKGGTDVSRSVADLTLKDDNFATIVSAIREGRTVFQNIRKFISYELSCNISELVTLFIGVLLVPYLGWKAPVLLALQILFMNLVTDDLPAITLGLNRPSEDTMKQKPRKKKEILNRGMFSYVFLVGSLMGMLVLSAFYLSFNVLGQNLETSRTVALATLILLEIVNAFNFRSFRYKVLTRSPFVNIYLFYASLISLLATFLIFYSPLKEAFETVPLNFYQWIPAIVASLVLLVMLDFSKDFHSRRLFTSLQKR